MLRVTYGQAGAVCPQCGSAAAVHSVDELAAMARARLGQFGLTDNVIFLAGGRRMVPMSSLSRGFTLEQADAVVAQLRNG